MTTHIKRAIRRQAEVIRAGWRAFRYRTRIGAPVLREGLAFLLRGFRKHDPVTPAIWRARLRACRRGCDIYDPKNRTCGTSGAESHEVLEANGALHPSGCSCLVGLKARAKKAKCFLETIGAPSRWSVRSVSLDAGGFELFPRSHDEGNSEDDGRGKPADRDRSL